MHRNELVNILSSLRSDVERQQDRLEYLLSPQNRDAPEIDREDAREVRRLLQDILRELDEAITQKNIGRG